MREVFRYLWQRRTTTFGYIQLIIGVLAASNGVFDQDTLKYIILANSLLLATLGHYNNRANQIAPDNETEQGVA